jgi:hypothetical protein
MLAAEAVEQQRKVQQLLLEEQAAEEQVDPLDQMEVTQAPT